MSVTRNAILLLLFGIFFVPETAEARSFRVDQVPNGATFGCETCHMESDPSIDGTRNAFGEFVEFNGLEDNGDPPTAAVVWLRICAQDADGDLYDNDEELGDDGCNWRIGDAAPPLEASNPGDRDSIPCGNGVADGPEECDGDDLDGQTCESQSQPSGTLGCNMTDCTFDTTGCDGSMPNTNNSNNTNNTNGSNGSNNDTGGMTQPDPMPGTNDAEPDEPAQDDAGAACDGTMTVEEPSADSAAAVIGMLLVVAFRRKR